MNVEILVFDGFEELDAFGPLNALATGGVEVALVCDGPPCQVRAAHGSVIVPERELSRAPDTVVVPGGGWADRGRPGTWAEVQRGVLPEAISQRFAAGSTVAAVSTGAMLLASAGLLRDRPAVTHHLAFDELRAAGARVIDARLVDDGRVVTAGGTSAGIDLGLWLLERVRGTAAADASAWDMEHVRAPAAWRRPENRVHRSSPLELPDCAIAHAALELARATEPAYLYHHSIRSYLFARLVAKVDGQTDFDDDLLFVACVLHDVGLTDQADKANRFEVDGADAAADLMRAHGYHPASVDVVWQAIALHTSAQIAERRSREIALTRAGITMDFGDRADLVPDELATQIHQRYPRMAMARRLADDITRRAGGRPAKAPWYSLPGCLLRERRDGLTEIEREARASRWGE